MRRVGGEQLQPSGWRLGPQRRHVVGQHGGRGVRPRLHGLDEHLVLRLDDHQHDHSLQLGALADVLCMRCWHAAQLE